jgi:hypothetical protein
MAATSTAVKRKGDDGVHAAVAGPCFFCAPGNVGELGFEHDSRDEPIVRLWNSVNMSPAAS